MKAAVASSIHPPHPNIGRDEIFRMEPHAPTTSLANATALVIGIGGLGAPCCLALADAGVGRLLLVDPDTVDRSNLPRQPLYDDADVGRTKVDVARDHLTRRWPALAVVPIAARFDGVWDARFTSADVIVDGTDTVAAKFTINDAAVRTGLPLVHAGAIGWQGQLLTVLPGQSACYRCVFEDAPPPEDTPSCDEAGVLGPAVALAGTLQAAEVVRVLRGEPPHYANSLLSFDLLDTHVRHVPVARRPGCCACDAPSTALAGRSLH